MIPELLCDIGEALYGPHWRAPLALELGISERSLRRWANAHQPIPPDIPLELIAIIDKRCNGLAALRERLIPLVPTE